MYNFLVDAKGVKMYTNGGYTMLIVRQNQYIKHISFGGGGECSLLLYLPHANNEPQFSVQYVVVLDIGVLFSLFLHRSQFWLYIYIFVFLFSLFLR